MGRGLIQWHLLSLGGCKITYSVNYEKLKTVIVKELLETGLLFGQYDKIRIINHIKWVV